MDIDILSGIIKELIIDNDRVPVRGMGYFISESCKACLSEDKTVVYPPSRHISFRSDENASEDMIERYYSEIHNADLETIKVEFDLFIKELKSVLFNKKSIAFAGLGVMRSTLEGNIYFVTNDQNNFLSSVISMEPVSVKEIDNLHKKSDVDKVEESGLSEKIEVEQKDETIGQTEEKIEKNPKKKSKALIIFLSIIIAAAVLFIIFLVLIKMGIFDSLLYSTDELELIRNSIGQ